MLGAIAEGQRAVDGALEEFARILDEVAAMGVVLRGLDLRMVDFPTEVAGVRLYLCWLAGEPTIRYWHGCGEGFSSRRTIEALGLPG